MSAKFEKLVQEFASTDNPNPVIVDELCRAIQDGHGRDVFESMKHPLKRGDATTQSRAATLLDECFERTGMTGATVLATEAWMDRIVKVSKLSHSVTLKHQLHDMVTRWATTYTFRPFQICADKLSHLLPVEAVRGPNGSFSASGSGIASTTPISNRSFRNNTAQPPNEIESFLMQLHDDMGKFEVALQRPDRMTPSLLIVMRRHHQELQSLLMRVSFPEHVKFTLLQEQRNIDELLGLHDALYGSKEGAPSPQPPVPTVAVAPKPDLVMNSPKNSPKHSTTGGATTATQLVAPAANTADPTIVIPRVVVDLQEFIRHLKALLAHEKSENKGNMEKVEALESEISQLDEAAKASGPTSVCRGPPKGFISNRAKVLDASAKSLKSELTALRSKVREMTAQQLAACDRLQETLRDIPMATERERKRDGKALQRLQELYANEQKLRKQYYHTIQELKGNMRVFCRVRPTVDDTASRASCVLIPKEDEVIFSDPSGTKKSFEFDGVFGPADDQEDVYQDTRPVIDSLLEGNHVCILAYGERNSGKRFTLHGVPSDVGLTYRSFDRLFEAIEERADTESSSVDMSALEITASDELKDMLATTQSELEIRSGGETGCYVSGLTTRNVPNADAAHTVLNSLFQRVSPAPISQWIVSVVIRTVSKQTTLRSFSKLSLVHLGSSEARAQSRGLNAFVDLITALSAGQVQAPFRASRLTQYLQEHFTGDVKVLLYACVNPTSVQETLATLTFAQKARSVSLVKVKKGASSAK